MVQFNRVPTVTGEWECMECGYIQEGDEGHRPQKCPECNASSDALEFFSYDEEEEDWEEDVDDGEESDEDFEDDFLDDDDPDDEFDDDDR